MVQRGYSLALDDLEVLPLWEEILVCSKIMEDVFDKDHVKEMSYELAGAYLHRPEMMFLQGMDLFMYSCITLLLAHGENFVFESIDYVTQYFHLLTIVIQCISPQEGKLFIELHDQQWARMYDGDNHLLYSHGKVLYYFMYVHLMYRTIYYSLVDDMIHSTNHLSKHHLPYYFLKLQWERLCCVHLRHCLCHAHQGNFEV